MFTENRFWIKFRSHLVIDSWDRATLHSGRYGVHPGPRLAHFGEIWKKTGDGPSTMSKCKQHCWNNPTITAPFRAVQKQQEWSPRVPVHNKRCTILRSILENLFFLRIINHRPVKREKSHYCSSVYARNEINIQPLLSLLRGSDEGSHDWVRGFYVGSY